MASCRRSPVAVAALVVVLVSLGALGLRSAGLLESQELAAYDWYVRLRPFDPPPDSRILIVGITEEDIQRQGTWPLPDGVLADAMENLARFGPRAIGLDIYRDISVPPGTEKLREVLRRDGHIVGVMKFGARPADGVAAPPSLKGTDRVGFNVPERPGWTFPGPDLHWDVSLKTPIPFGTAGILYLTDTPPEQGAFTLVPGFHRRVDEWLANLAPGADPRQQDLHALGSMPIGGRAGDLIIWHHALPHGSRPNRGTQPRMVQYIAMFPTEVDEQDEWI